MHVNLSVNDLDASIAFYNSLFDSEPDVAKTDYAKWMLRPAARLRMRPQNPARAVARCRW